MENSSKNLFITGKAGTGKSTLLDFFCTKTQKNPVVLAPTGIAALNVKGQTIHNFFNFYIDVTVDSIRNKKTKPKNKKLYEKLETIIIDEASMLRADLLDCIEAFLSMYGKNKGADFGGVQMIFVGDLYQLPPVIGKNERSLFTSHYKTPYFFSAKSLEEKELEVIELETVYRQKDENFVNLLNKIRNNSVETEDIDILNQQLINSDTNIKDEDFTITLTTTNKKADEINNHCLSAITGNEYNNEAVISGNFGKEYYPTAITLNYKVGTQIMLLNNDAKKRWVNGTIGYIEKIKYDEAGDEYLRVRLIDNKKLVTVVPYSWEIYNFSVKNNEIIPTPVGSFTQYPFRLAWAVTIHKSQGKTFHQVTIDLDKSTFASGQTYVALSRCTSFEGMHLKVPIKKQHIRTDPRIYKFLTSHAHKKASESLSLDQKIKIIKQSIKSKIPLEITYLKANDTKSVRTILPTMIGDEIYKGKPFLGMRAFCKTRQEERMFSVERILELKQV